METTLKTPSDWFNQGHLSKELKQLARSLKISIVVAAQMKELKDAQKDISGNDKLSVKNLSYAKMVTDNCDWVFGFLQTEEDEMLGRIRLQFLKGRHSKKETITIKKDFGIMSIVDFEKVEKPK